MKENEQYIGLTPLTVTLQENGQAEQINGVWTLDSGSSVDGPVGPVDSDVFPLWQQVLSP